MDKITLKQKCKDLKSKRIPQGLMQNENKILKAFCVFQPPQVKKESAWEHD